ncbi:hypothetical protein AVEN_200926-1 [Araneus ventricosus]|uniref:Uncharacterized protein n=1 Tax=Araneus ventricosus TaxID=182803 RepID=A0A4Y2RF65_ARAVE|nr:hypothetical protein AVEN_200926-1 [Araneus ventricosus]
MTKITPEVPPPLQTSAPHLLEIFWPSTHDLAYNGPNIRRIVSGIGFRTWNSPTPKPRPYYYATAALKLDKEIVGVLKYCKRWVLTLQASGPRYLRELFPLITADPRPSRERRVS